MEVPYPQLSPGNIEIVWQFGRSESCFRVARGTSRCREWRRQIGQIAASARSGAALGPPVFARRAEGGGRRPSACSHSTL
jgi:hypothetical protein